VQAELLSGADEWRTENKKRSSEPARIDHKRIPICEIEVPRTLWSLRDFLEDGD
jgi:hypothetical protein